jgi:hypothetical protein
MVRTTEPSRNGAIVSGLKKILSDWERGVGMVGKERQ